MFDHVGFPVRDAAKSRAFYTAALAPLGIGRGDGIRRVAAWVRQARQAAVLAGSGMAHRRAGVHIAFAAATRAQVDAFYHAAMAAGGKDNGAPGLRPHYHANYYGAFVLDPDGHNIEAVCHAAEIE